MAKFMVYEGLEFGSVSATPGTFETQGSDPLDAITLDSIATALGADIVTDLDALKAWWGTDTNTLLAIDRGSLTNVSPLRAGTYREPPPATADVTLHQTSYKWILPKGASSAYAAKSTDNTESGRERNRAVVKALENCHDNIKKHTTAVLAWNAYNDYDVYGRARCDDERSKQARAAYFINPNVDENKPC